MGKPKPRKKISTFRKCVGAIVLILLSFGVLAFACGWVQTFYIVSNSMSPTIERGDYLLVDARKSVQPQLGDIVAFHSPEFLEIWLCKRIVALPGDRVKFRYGGYYRNGKRQSDIDYALGDLMSAFGYYSRRLADDEYFVMGDNQMLSSDSRDFGPVRAKNMIGVVTRIYWPPRHARPLLHPSPDANPHLDPEAASTPEKKPDKPESASIESTMNIIKEKQP